MLAIASGCRNDAASTSPTEAAALTPKEWGEGFRLCLERAGVTVVDEAAGAFRYEPGPGMSRKGMVEVAAGCREDLGPVPNPRDPVTASKYYAAYLGTASCLKDLGYAVTPAPSREVFVAKFAEGTGDFWDPFNDVYEQFPSGEAQNEAEQQCSAVIE